MMVERTEEQYKGILSKLIDRLGLIMVLLGLWFLIYPKPYEVLFIVLMLLCPLHLLLTLSDLKRNQVEENSVEISEPTEYNKKKNVYLPPIGIVSLVVLIRLNVDIDSYQPLVFILVPLVIVFVFMWTTVLKIKNKTKKYLGLIYSVSIYGFAIIFGANSIYDKSEPIIFYAEVLDKKESRSSKGRRSYHIWVTSWKPHSEKEEVTVTIRQYIEIQIGQTIEVRIRNGLFNIPYYYIMLKDKEENGT